MLHIELNLAFTTGYLHSHYEARQHNNGHDSVVTLSCPLFLQYLDKVWVRDGVRVTVGVHVRMKILGFP